MPRRRGRGRRGGGGGDDDDDDGASRYSGGTTLSRAFGGGGGVSAALGKEIKSIAEAQKKLQTDVASTHMRLEAKIDQLTDLLKQRR